MEIGSRTNAVTHDVLFYFICSIGVDFSPLSTTDVDIIVVLVLEERFSNSVTIPRNLTQFIRTFFENVTELVDVLDSIVVVLAREEEDRGNFDFYKNQQRTETTYEGLLRPWRPD